MLVTLPTRAGGRHLTTMVAGDSCTNAVDHLPRQDALVRNAHDKPPRAYLAGTDRPGWRKGKLYTGMLGPDGRFGAFGGNLDGDSETESIYLFDLGTGDLYLHLSDLQSSVMVLAPSPESRMLAALALIYSVSIFLN